MAKIKPLHHAHPCANCGHQDMHGEVAGCIAVTSAQGAPPSWCDCTEYVAPPSAASTKAVGRTIPSRNTDPGTSHEAAARVVIRSGTQRTLLLQAFQAMDFQEPENPGLTDEEAMNRAVGVTAWSEYAKRCSELRDGGLIVPTGETRVGEAGTPRIVSKITDVGRAALAGLR